MTGLNRLSAIELLDGIRASRFTAGEIAEDVLARIKERDQVIHAWQHLSPERVAERADVLDAADRPGPLHGIPVGIKDIMNTGDMPTAYGSSIYAGHQPAADAAVVTLLRNAGANIIGKTVTTEFAYFQPGPTVNPVDLACTPGGSSSGSAAAVADYMVPVAFGSQTAGSINRPASYCGIVGYKPSYGVHSLAGIKPFSHSLDTLGWMARSVDDVALVRSALLRIPYSNAKVTLKDPPRIGFCRTWEWAAAGPDSRASLEFARERFTAGGADVVAVDLPELFMSAVESQKIIMAFEAAQSLAPEWSNHREFLSDPLASLIEQGIACSLEDYASARTHATECRAAIANVFDGYDALLTPGVTGEAPEGHAATGDPIFSRLWTLLHLPSVSVPGFHGSHGRPVGVQLIGRMMQDENLLRVASWCHKRLSA
jgi:Asp-tRNA(Asn)/Glu-tRNA(Gln) amidotransferase A subunit family amidase